MVTHPESCVCVVVSVMLGLEALPMGSFKDSSSWVVCHSVGFVFLSGVWGRTKHGPMSVDGACSAQQAGMGAGAPGASLIHMLPIMFVLYRLIVSWFGDMRESSTRCDLAWGPFWFIHRPSHGDT